MSAKLTDGERADLEVGIPLTSPEERRFLQPLLSSLVQSAPGISLRVTLVDNLTRDGLERAYAICPQANILRNSERLTYAENLNRVIEGSRARYVLLMNPDMYFDSKAQCLAKMVRFMDLHPECGLSTCRLYHPSRQYAFSARRHQTWRVIAARRFGLASIFRRELNQYLCTDHAREEDFDCDWVSGCFMFLRSETIAEIGPLDTGYRKYFEDVDYAARVTQAGWRVMMHGGTYCYHHEQRASRQLFSRDACLHLRSYSRWLRKWGFSPPRHAPPAHRLPAPHFEPNRARAAA